MTGGSNIQYSDLVVSIHQPEHLPYYGFFSKILQSDVFVVLDDVQFEKNNWQNRNRILVQDTVQYVTVPVKYKFGQRINEVEIDKTVWKRLSQKNIKSISQAYANHPYYNDFFDRFSAAYLSNYDRLIDLNYELLFVIVSYLDIDTMIYTSSGLNVEGSSTDRLVNICKKLNAGVYLSGNGGKHYLDEGKFGDTQVVYNGVEGIRYPQIRKTEEFVPFLSVLDGIFNHGKDFKTFLW